MILEKVQKTIKHNFQPQNLPTTMVEMIAVVVWMSSTLIFYFILGDLFPELGFLSIGFSISIIASYFVSDGLMYSFLYRNFRNLGPEIENDELSKYLLLPTDTVNYIGTRNIQFSSFIQIPIALMMLLLLGEYTLESLMIWAISILIGLLMIYNLWFIFSFISFWYKVGHQASSLFEELTIAGMFPLNIYLQFPLFWPLLPFAFVASGGALILSQGAYWVVLVQIGMLFVFYLLRKFLWGAGVERLRS